MNTVQASVDNFIEFSIGIDDTDSVEEGMCTTYLGAKLYFRLLAADPLIIITDFPYLIRHNPNVPNRTKGNGSIVIKGKIVSSLISWLQTVVLNLFYYYSRLDDPNTNPGLVIWYGKVSSRLQKFSKVALWDIIDISAVDKFISLKNVFFHYPKGKNGLIGCLAGIGTNLNVQDHTYELLVYRNPPFTRKRLGVNYDKILNVKEGNYVFNCVDAALPKKPIKIVPLSGKDPVFCGIRGELPVDVLDYWQKIQPQPQPEFFLIFKTNQGTDCHLQETPINSLEHPKFSDFKVVSIQGNVDSSPYMAVGGHASFQLRDTNGQIITCFAYEPTKKFRNIIMSLEKGDLVEIGGSVRPASPVHPQSINIERLKVLALIKKIVTYNPICPQCNKRTESAGKNQPFRCRKCKIKLNKTNSKIKHEQPRTIVSGLYLPTIDAQRHLTKPHKRYAEEIIKIRAQKIKTGQKEFLVWKEKLISLNQIDMRKMNLAALS